MRLQGKSLATVLRSFGACSEAMEWAKPFGTDWEAAWNACERGDWSLWIAARVGVERTLLVRAAVACVQPAVTAYVPANEPRPQACLDAVLAWVADPTEANLQRVREARQGAAYAAYAADAYATAYAAGAGAAQGCNCPLPEPVS